MLVRLKLNDDYFLFDPERFADVLVSLQSAKPFVAYPGFTRVESDGKTTHLLLDGTSTSMKNTVLAKIIGLELAKLPAATPSSDGMEP